MTSCGGMPRATDAQVGTCHVSSAAALTRDCTRIVLNCMPACVKRCMECIPHLCPCLFNVWSALQSFSPTLTLLQTFELRVGGRPEIRLIPRRCAAPPAVPPFQLARLAAFLAWLDQCVVSGVSRGTSMHEECVLCLIGNAAVPTIFGTSAWLQLAMFALL
mmetsp:Transcript_63088/g.159185  ORF Transcript_63088/g.159185 Transcript_63088/m.159185 type:complete len:161 (-) Transcript_63088:23-505(-)